MSMMAVGRIPHTLNYAHACMQSALIEKWKILICLENIMFFIYHLLYFYFLIHLRQGISNAMLLELEATF